MTPTFSTIGASGHTGAIQVRYSRGQSEMADDTLSQVVIVADIAG